MAKDMLDAIYAAEEESRRRESDAKTQAAQSVADAKKQAEALIAARVAKARQDADAELDGARRNSERRRLQADKDAQAECRAISEIAAKNRPSVIQKAADAILG